MLGVRDDHGAIGELDLEARPVPEDVGRGHHGGRSAIGTQQAVPHGHRAHGRPAVRRRQRGVERERLPDRRSRRHHDHLAGVQPVRQLIQLEEPGRHTDHLVGATRSRLDLGQRLLEHLGEHDIVLAAALLGDRVDLGLGPVDDVLDVALALAIPHLDDPRAGLDEPAQHRSLVDDLGVVGGIGRRRHRLHELVQIRGPTDAGQVAALGQLIGDRDRVSGLPPPEEVEDRLEDRLVRRPIEVVPLDQRQALGDRILVEQHRAQHRLLGRHVLRRHPLIGGALVAAAQLSDRQCRALRSVVW